MAESARGVSERKSKEYALSLLKVTKDKVLSRELEIRIQELEGLNLAQADKIAELEKELERYSLGELSTEMSEELQNSIVGLRAMTFSPDSIVDKLKYQGTLVDIEQVELIVNNRESLSAQVKLHWTESEEAFEKELKTNPNILKQSNLADNQFCIDMIKKEIKLSGSEGEDLLKQLDRLDKYVNTKTKLLGDVVLKNDEIKTSTVVTDMQDEYEKTKSNIINFSSLEGIKII